MFDSDEHLSAACSTVAQAAHEALAWVERSDKQAIRDDGQLIKTLRKRIVEAGKLRKAASRKMCAGVFGASQAGKSYLISALARKDGQPLMASFGTTDIDFIAEINPEGGKESTGLVTRFTIDKSVKVPQEHPVRVGLLSECDVIKILANSYTFDVDHPDDEDLDKHAAAIQAVIDKLHAKAGSVSAMTVEDVYDLEDYCNNRLLKTARMKALKKSGFWDEAAVLAPALTQEDRVTLFGLLWEDAAVYTDVYHRLLSALTLLGHPDQAFCEIGALLEDREGAWKRSDHSIINVSTLNGIGGDSEDVVSIMAPDSRPVSLPRAEVTALIAEMIIVMKEQPFPFFDHTDLLDFPGARSRTPVPARTLSKPENRTENFLRGKVAYLFDRYCDEQELTSMLLCVGPSNQEVSDLPGMIEGWIATTHGKTPQERARAETALFFLLTKFDTAFEQAAGKGTDGGRWDTRLQASLIAPFADHAHSTNWVREWTPGQSFNNLFWVRNPHFRQDALFDYESSDSMAEKGIRSDKVDFVETLRQGYLNHPTVQTYFADPEAAWAAGMRLNDGGVSRIADALGPVCRPDMKRQQTGQRLERLCASLHSSLKGFYISGDVDTLRSEKKAVALEVSRMLAVALQRQKLGQLLYAMRLDERDAYTQFSNSERAAARTTVGGPNKGEVVAVTTYKRADDILGALGLDEPVLVDQTKPAEGEKAPEQGAQDLAERFVSDLEKAWSAQIAEIAENEELAAYLGVDAQLMVKLADELRLAGHRHGVFDRMIGAVRRGQQLKTGREPWVWRQVSPACAIFNAYLSHLCLGGHDIPPGSMITDVNGREVHVFQPRTVVDDMPELKEEAEAYETAYFLDWIRGLQDTVIGNAAFQVGFTGDAEENAVLGDILSRLHPLVAA